MLIPTEVPHSSLAEVLVGLVVYAAGWLSGWIRRQVKR